MTYNEAIAYVLREKGAAYTFIPDERAGKTVGGQIYVIEYDKDHETDPDEYYEYNILYSGGLFRSSSGEGEIYAPEEVPEQAMSATYLPADPRVVYLYESQLDYFLLRLQGMSEEEANNELNKPRS